MHSRSLSLSLFTLVSITNALSLPMDQDYQSGAPATDLNPEMLQTMDGPMNGQNGIPGGNNLEENPAGHPAMSHDRSSASPGIITTTNGTVPQSPSPGGSQTDENPSQDLLDGDDYPGELSGSSQLPKRRVSLVSPPVSSNTIIGRETRPAMRAVIDLHTALERRQDDSELGDGTNAGDDALGMGSPLSEFDGNGEMGGADMANSDIEAGTELQRRNLIERPSNRLRHRHNAEDHLMEGPKNTTNETAGESNASRVKKTEDISESSENAGDKTEKGPARKVNPEDPTATETSQQATPGQPGMPTTTNNFNTPLSNGQVEGIPSGPNLTAKLQDEPPASFYAKFRPQSLLPKEQTAGRKPAEGFPLMGVDPQTGEEGPQSNFLPGKSNAVSPNDSNGSGVGPTEGPPFGMGAGSTDMNGKSINAEMEDPSSDVAAKDVDEKPDEGQEDEVDQSPEMPMASPGEKPASSSETASLLPQSAGPPTQREFTPMDQPV